MVDVRGLGWRGAGGGAVKTKIIVELVPQLLVDTKICNFNANFIVMPVSQFHADNES